MTPPAAQRPLIPLAFGLAVFAITLWAPQVFNDGDTFWHVAAGRLMIASRTVLATDPFSSTWAGRPWLTHEWLSEVLFGGAFNLAGWSGVALLAATCAGAAAGLLARHTGRWTRGLPQLCLLTGAFALWAPHLLVRPHVLAWPILEMWAAELVIARAEDRAPRWTLLPLMTLWANLHGSFMFGLALIAPFALEALIAAPAARLGPVVLRWGGFGLAAAAAALLTPHGIEGPIYAVKLMTMSSLPGIGEWKSAELTLASPLVLAVLATTGFAIWRRMPIPPLRILILLGLTAMAVKYNRHEQLMGFAGALVLAAPLGAVTQPPAARWTPPRGFVPATAAALAVMLALARLGTPIRWTDSPTRPVQALASVPVDLRAKPLLNEFPFGGYLIFEGVRPYVDSRSDMYGDAFLRDYLRLARDPAALQAALARYGVGWALTAPGSPLDRAMAAQSGWRRTYADRFADVYQPIPPTTP